MKRYLIFAGLVGVVGLVASVASSARPAPPSARAPEQRRAVALQQQSSSALPNANDQAASSLAASSWRLTEQDRAKLRDQLYEFRRGGR